MTLFGWDAVSTYEMFIELLSFSFLVFRYDWLIGDLSCHYVNFKISVGSICLLVHDNLPLVGL